MGWDFSQAKHNWSANITSAEALIIYILQFYWPIYLGLAYFIDSLMIRIRIELVPLASFSLPSPKLSAPQNVTSWNCLTNTKNGVLYTHFVKATVVLSVSL